MLANCFLVLNYQFAAAFFFFFFFLGNNDYTNCIGNND